MLRLALGLGWRIHWVLGTLTLSSWSVRLIGYVRQVLSVRMCEALALCPQYASVA
jgi:hypothetical protein